MVRQSSPHRGVTPPTQNAPDGQSLDITQGEQNEGPASAVVCPPSVTPASAPPSALPASAAPASFTPLSLEGFSLQLKIIIVIAKATRRIMQVTLRESLSNLLPGDRLTATHTVMTEGTPSATPVSPAVPPPPAGKRGPSAGLLLGLGCGAFILLVVVAGIIMAGMSGDTVDDGAVLKMSMGGPLPEHVVHDDFSELFGPKIVSLLDHRSNLKKAAADKRIKGVLLKLEPIEGGWAKIEELRDSLTEFKKSGKFVIAYSEYMGEKEYALALAADSIIMPKDAPFEFNGMAQEVSHYPGLLEKLGIEVQYFRYGKYKSTSGESFGRKALTEPVKEMITENLQSTFAHFVTSVAQYRKLDEAKVKALIDDSHFKSDWALENKLIDQLAYWDEVEDLIKQKAGTKVEDPVKWESPSKYLRVSAEAAGIEPGKHSLALIFSQGLIVAGKGGGNDPFGGGDTQGSTPIIRALRKAVEDEDVKAILFRVDSPGGAGLGCDYIRREVEKAAKKKPVIVSMSDVAASGGYWVSMSATAIVAQPTTYTGSIGIFAVVPSLKGTYEKLGLNQETFVQGAHADALNGSRPFTEEEAKRFDGDLFNSYQRFVTLAAEGRGKTYDQMEPLAQGRTWLGDKARELGRVDKVGGYEAAIALAKEKAGVPADERLNFKLFDKKKGLIESILSKDDDDEDEEGQGDAASMAATAVLKSMSQQAGVAPLLRKAPSSAAFTRQVLEGREHLYPMMEYTFDTH